MTRDDFLQAVIDAKVDRASRSTKAAAMVLIYTIPARVAAARCGITEGAVSRAVKRLSPRVCPHCGAKL